MSALPQSVSLLGYGRFGRALADLLADAGVAVHALDPHVAVPAARAVGSLAALCAAAEVLIVAVPVAALRAALTELRPHLGAGHLVLDVGSVKARPAEDCEAVLGAAIPWVGTHPLFGPVSLALAERPLRVVVCPNAQHKAAAARAQGLYEALGCQVVLTEAKEHDWVMASTHAVAFFVAKGMLDAGFGEDTPFAPPSFQAMARTLAAVRGDAGHLFRAIQQENPFSGAARQRLLAALSEVHRTLAAEEAQAPAADGGAAPGGAELGGSAGGAPVDRLHIPDLGARSPELAEVRELIDGVDREIMDLLARRAHLAQRAARAKAELGRAVRDPARETALLEARRAWAAERGLDAAEVEALFTRIVAYARRVQGGR